MKEEEQKKLKSISLGAEYRGLTNVEKAVKLVQEHSAKPTTAANAMGVEKNKLKRALKAVEEGRNMGVRGRPTLLQPEEEEVLVSIVKGKINQKTPPKFSEFTADVCTTLAFLATYFPSYLHTQRPKIFIFIFSLSAVMYSYQILTRILHLVFRYFLEVFDYALFAITSFRLKQLAQLSRYIFLMLLFHCTH